MFLLLLKIIFIIIIMNLSINNNFRKIKSNESLNSEFSVENYSRSCDSLLDNNLEKNYNNLINKKLKENDPIIFNISDYYFSKSCNNLIEENYSKINIFKKENNLSKSYDDICFLDRNNILFETFKVKKKRIREDIVNLDKDRDTPTILDAINIIKRNISTPTFDSFINSSRK